MLKYHHHWYEENHLKHAYKQIYIDNDFAVFTCRVMRTYYSYRKFSCLSKVAKNYLNFWMTYQLTSKGYFWLLGNSLMCLISRLHLWMSCSSLCSSSPRAETSAVSLCLWLSAPSTSSRLQPLWMERGVRRVWIKTDFGQDRALHLPIYNGLLLKVSDTWQKK